MRAIAQIAVFACMLTCIAEVSFGQANPQTEDHVFDVANVLSGLNHSIDLAKAPEAKSVSMWWDKHVHTQLLPGTSPQSVDINQLLVLALDHSAKLAVDSEVPLIQETRVHEVDANFDWTAYMDNVWDDLNEPIGSALTVGNNVARFFNDHKLGVTSGLRRRNRIGTEFDVSQRLGHQNNNSEFFVPNNQGSAVLTLGFTQPLLRGGGKAVNTSLNVLTRIQAQTAQAEFTRQIQSHLLEITKAYWNLYRARGELAQKVSLYLKTREIYQRLKARGGLDTRGAQLASATAAYQNRQADLIRAQTDVKNAQTRLKLLINAPALDVESSELIPTEHPTTGLLSVDNIEEMRIAVLNRPEVFAAMKEIRAGAVRVNVSRNELLPILNLVTSVFVSGLQGDTDIGVAWVDQFSEGAPSYSVGLNLEVPLGNRVANARLRRRKLELRQLESKYRLVLEQVKSEVEIAVRELHTAYREIIAKREALASANLEANMLRARWERGAGKSSAASLNLESLLRAQERVSGAEADYLNTLMIYNVSIIGLRQANGTLLQTHDVCFERNHLNGLPTDQTFEVQQTGNWQPVAPSTTNAER